METLILISAVIAFGAILYSAYDAITHFSKTNY